MFRVLLPLATGRAFESVRLARMQDLRLIDVPQGCHLISSPAQLARLPSQADAAYPRVASVLSAGGPLADVDARACETFFGVAVTEIYGSSETGAVAIRRRIDGAVPRWQPLPGVEFRAPQGVLEIRSPQLFIKDWFRSADRALMQGECFELAGRVDRIVKLEEKRVSLDAVEQVLMDSSLLQQVRALVLPGQRPVLAIAAQPSAQGWALAEAGKPQLVDALLTHLREAARIEVLPRSWRFIEPWPVTADGKTPEGLLRERFDRRNPEFRVLEHSPVLCVVELWVSPTAPFFAGHFPQQPILPGVVQVDWLVWLSRVLLDIEAGFAGLEAAKFRRVILPGRRLTVSLWNDAANHRTRYEIRDRNAICASGRIVWNISA
jgi:acyl-coenzyme A synthetase/AMP-(fatty) acid ligase